MELFLQIYVGKNAYALSVLRQVETKIEGLDVEDNRFMELIFFWISLKVIFLVQILELGMFCRKVTISEQVDHLIQQATNVDNLCNMYEGWTPWI